MTQVIYSMQFTGQIVPDEGANNQRNVKAVARSSRIESLAGPGGIKGSVQPVEGEDSTMESVVILTGNGRFQEHGSIAFGDSGNTLRFTTIGEGHISSSPEPSVNHGSVIWRVEGGEGQFEGAAGLITSNFTISTTGDVTDHQFGVIYTG